MNRNRVSVYTLLILLAVGAVAVRCATSPEGRSQVILLPDSEMDSMGAQSFQQMKSETPVSNDPEKNDYVQCVTSLLLRQQGENPADWEVRVFNSKDINAFALPGRKIGVYTGILPVANSNAQLAAVLGHEIGHVIARHGNERVSTGLLAQGGALAVGAALDKGDKNHGLLMAALGLGAQFGVILPHSRTQESEADMIGVELMAKAGFDPRDSVRLWENMARAGGGQPPEWLSTHPSNSTRIRQLQDRMPKALELYNASNLKTQASRCQP